MIRTAIQGIESELNNLGYQVMPNEGFWHPILEKECIGNWHIIEEDGTKKILLKKGQTERQELFALAHELGHALHAVDTEQNSEDPVWQIYSDDGEDQERHILYEIDANLRGVGFIPDPLKMEFLTGSVENIATYFWDGREWSDVVSDPKVNQYAARFPLWETLKRIS